MKNESSIPETSRKLNFKWLGPYRVIEVIRDGSAYLLENVFTSQQCQGAEDKVKPYYNEEEWIPEPQEVIVPEDEDREPEPLPPRVRRFPRRYTEECCSLSKWSCIKIRTVGGRFWAVFAPMDCVVDILGV